MGRASRWLRSLLRGTKNPDSKEKRSWGFSFREKPHQLPQPSRKQVPAPVPSRPAVLDEDEQSKRAIAVAAATAAVAEAAVAAAQAAAAVVRLTSSARNPAAVAGNAKREVWAAVKIQSAFRSYLARRALRALRGLVKLQALVRGNIVRKQATETLRCMQALVRVQERARASRSIQSERSKSDRGLHMKAGPLTPEKHEKTVQGNVRKPDRSGPSKRNLTKPASVGAAAGWNWLDKWMEERHLDIQGSYRKSGMTISTDDERNAKILEVDPGKPHFNHKKRSNQKWSSCSTVSSDQNSRSFATMPESLSKDSTCAQQSVPSPSSVEMQQCFSPLRFAAESADYVESPQFYSASSRPGSSRRGPFTPSKSECSRSLFSGYSDYPNYMGNTESFRAKVRSQSAPKQRPDFEKSSSFKRASAHGLMQNSGTLSYKSSSLQAKFANKGYPGSGRLDKLGRPIRV